MELEIRDKQNEGLSAGKSLFETANWVAFLVDINTREAPYRLILHTTRALRNEGLDLASSGAGGVAWNAASGGSYQ